MTRQAGFTMVELITVMVLLGVLAAIGVPRLMGDNTIGAAVFGDQVVSALRMAQKSAVARRRTVCVTTTTTTIDLRVRAAVGPGACDTAMVGIENGQYDSKDATITMAGVPATLRFQPDGTIVDANNLQFGALQFTIRMGTLDRRTIRLEGATGYVD